MPPLRVLVVARWYPAIDDPVRGSFVADQVDALAATGVVAPVVASFEFARLNRVAERREPEREAIHRRVASAAERPDALTPGGLPAATGTWRHLAAVPVARLPVASGPEDGPAQEGDDHLAAFLPFVESLVLRAGPRGRPVDLVHAHTGFPDGEMAAAAARRLGVPFVVTEHASRTAALLRDPDVRRRYAAVLGAAARILVVSGALGAEIRAALPELAGILDERLAVVPNAVPVELFRAAPRRERRAGELLYVGTRKPDKGIATLLEAFSLARARRPDLTLRLVGQSPTPGDEAAWLARAAGLGVTDAVSFEPATDRAGVAAAMARADLFVHASRHETFGVVLAEALASGLPVVATRSGGGEEILGPDPAVRGALVDVDDAVVMADAILATLARRDELDPLVLRADAQARFGAEGIAARLRGIYEEACGATDAVTADAGATAEAGIGLGAGSGPAATVNTATSDTGAADTAMPLPLVVSFNRVRAARLLAPLPADLLRELTLVTVRDPGDQPLPSGIGEVLAADLDTGYRAALEAVRRSAPPDGLRGRLVRLADPGAPERIAARTAAIGAAHARHRLETARQVVAEAVRGRGPSDVLCVDGYDVDAAGPALDAGLARLTPGGIRWLADRWTTRGRTDRSAARTRPMEAAVPVAAAGAAPDARRARTRRPAPDGT